MAVMHLICLGSHYVINITDPATPSRFSLEVSLSDTPSAHNIHASEIPNFPNRHRAWHIRLNLKKKAVLQLLQ